MPLLLFGSFSAAHDPQALVASADKLCGVGLFVAAGPRRPGEGVEDEEQGILSAEEVPATG
jgi:hypothetical protein